MATVKKINRKKKFVADGVFQAELHGFFSRALDDCGYSGFELTATLPKPEIRIKATKVSAVVAERPQRAIRHRSRIPNFRRDGANSAPGSGLAKLRLVVRTTGHDAAPNHLVENVIRFVPNVPRCVHPAMTAATWMESG